jgi:hypothetical protein
MPVVMLTCFDFSPGASGATVCLCALQLAVDY